MGCCDDKKKWISYGLNYDKIPDYWSKRLGTPVQRALKGDSEDVNRRFIGGRFTSRIKY